MRYIEINETKEWFKAQFTHQKQVYIEELMHFIKLQKNQSIKSQIN